MSRGRLYRALTVLSMAVGRGPAARAVAASAKLSSDDRLGVKSQRVVYEVAVLAST